MANKKGSYNPLPNEDLISQPPPYTPSEAGPSSPNHVPQTLVPSSGEGVGLYPTLQYVNQTSQLHHQYQNQSQFQYLHPGSLLLQQQECLSQVPDLPPTHAQETCVVGSPIILMRAPGGVKDLKAKPGMVVCQHCQYLVLTETSPENGSCTYLGILALLLVTSGVCCLLPLCMTSCKDIVHSCPNCQEDIGLYSRIKKRTFPVRRGR